jgi:uncharacterized protein
VGAKFSYVIYSIIYGESIMIKRFLIASALFCITASPAMAQRVETGQLSLNQYNVDPSAPSIELVISEQVTTKPDTAAFSTGVETSAPTAKEAMAKNAVKMNSVIAELGNIGIASKDVQTSGFSLTKEYTYPKTGKRRFKGYSVSNTVIAKLRDISKLGDALDALTAAGATEFEGPYFSLDNPEAAETEARDKAWATAYAKARLHARKAGFSDVKVIRVSEQISRTSNLNESVEAKYSYADAAAEGAMAAVDSSETPIAMGEVTVGVQVSIGFVMVK